MKRAEILPPIISHTSTPTAAHSTHKQRKKEHNATFSAPCLLPFSFVLVVLHFFSSSSHLSLSHLNTLSLNAVTLPLFSTFLLPPFNTKMRIQPNKHQSLPSSLPPFLHFLLIVENRGLPWLGSLLLVGRTRGGGIRRVVEGELDQAWRKGGRKETGMCAS